MFPEIECFMLPRSGGIAVHVTTVTRFCMAVAIAAASFAGCLDADGTAANEGVIAIEVAPLSIPRPTSPMRRF